MTSTNENSMASSPTNIIPCGDYQPRDEKGMPIAPPELVAIVCRNCQGYGLREPAGGASPVCSRCSGEGSVLIDKAKLKVMP